MVNNKSKPIFLRVKKKNLNQNESSGPGPPSIFHVGARLAPLLPQIKRPSEHRDQVFSFHFHSAPRFETGAHGDEDNFDGPGGEIVAVIAFILAFVIGVR